MGKLDQLRKLQQIQGKEIESKKYACADLNEATVKKIFDRCLARPDYRERKSYAQVLKKALTGQESEERVFEQQAIKDNSMNISYLFGQLKAVHECDSHMPLEYGILTYDDKKWTTSAEILFKLYELGIANANIIPFASQKANKTLLLTNIEGIKPTLSPKDPDFPAWWEAHKSEWETGQ